MRKVQLSNDEIADTLDHVADLLEVEDANAFRVRSYRGAAQTVRDLEEPVAEMLEHEGERVLKGLPGIGDKLAGSIRELATTGRLGLAEQLESEVWPGKLLMEVPGIGESLARRIHDELGISTLEELEVAAYDGRLERVEGIGPDRAEGVRIALSGMLSQSSRRKLRQAVGREAPSRQERPSVDLLLEIDEEYRRKAARDQLKKIAPKRFNPQGREWLPIMRVKREDWDFTVLFSNTELAHRTGKTHDWVVIYFERQGEQRQSTVVTAERGPWRAGGWSEVASGNAESITGSNASRPSRTVYDLLIRLPDAVDEHLDGHRRENQSHEPLDGGEGPFSQQTGESLRQQKDRAGSHPRQEQRREPLWPLGGLAGHQQHQRGHGRRAGDQGDGERHDERLALHLLPGNAFGKRKDHPQSDQEQNDAAGCPERPVRDPATSPGCIGRA